MVTTEDENLFSLHCRLNEVIPDLSAKENVER
jgi:hypothetical protein